MPLTWSQRRYMTDRCDIIAVGTDAAAETETFTVLSRGNPYLHLPTRNLEDDSVAGRQIRADLLTTDEALFPEATVVPSDAYLVNRTPPDPVTGEPSRLNGLFYRVNGPVQPFQSAGFRRAAEAKYDMRWDQNPDPDLVAIANA